MSQHDDDTPVDTADQDAWVDFTDSLRNALEKKLPQVPSMSGMDAHQYVLACKEAFWLSVNARAYDTNVDKENDPWD